MMEVWGHHVDIDVKKVKNVNSFISKQYSDEVSDEDVDDGVNDPDDNANRAGTSNASRSQAHSIHRSFLQQTGARIPSLMEQRRECKRQLERLRTRLESLVRELEELQGQFNRIGLYCGTECSRVNFGVTEQPISILYKLIS